MANTPFVSANFDDAITLQNLRTIGLVADANETSPAAATLNEVPEENQATDDSVEISRESRELARTDEPENTTTDANIRAEQAAAEERAAATAGNEGELLANTDIGNEEAGLDVAETLLTETGSVTEEIGAAEPVQDSESEPRLFQPDEDTLAAAEELETEEPTEIASAFTTTSETDGLTARPEETESAVTAEAQTESEIAAALETRAATTAAQTAEGTVPPEPVATVENAEPEEAVVETTAPIEEQAEELTRLNEVLNNINGLAGTAPVTGTEQESAENVRSQQQLLLQNVGTQLAQAVPPPSIISILG